MSRDGIAQQLQASLNIDVPEELVDLVVQYTKDPNLRIILLTGSGASGELKQFSDIDIVFLMGQPDFDQPAYELRYVDDRLVSLSCTTYQEWRDKLHQLAEVRYLRDALLNATLVYEVSEGIFETLWTKASQLDTSRFDLERQQLVEAMTTGYVEELHKIYNGVIIGDGQLIYYGLLGLQLGIWKILINYFDLYFESENHTNSAMRDALQDRGYDNMVRLWQVMWAVDEYTDMVERGKAAISLYLGIIELVDDCLTDKSRQFLNTTIKLGQTILD